MTSQEMIKDAADKLLDAVTYALNRMRTDPDFAYVAGLGTETFARLTAAYAAATGDDLERVRTLCVEDAQPEYRRREPRVVELQRRVDELESALAHGDALSSMSAWKAGGVP